MSRLWSWVQRPYTQPIQAAMFVLGVGLLGINLAGPQGADGPPLRPLSFSPEEMIFRITWFVLFLALSVSMLATFVHSISVIRRSAGNAARRWLRTTGRAAASLFAVALAISIADQYWGARSSWSSLSCLKTRIPMAWFFHALNAIGAIPTVFLVSGVAAICARLTDPVNLRAPDVRNAIADLRTLLYTIAVTLMIAAMELYALHTWITASVASADRPVTRAHAIVLGGGLGAVYSVFLFAVFVPATLIQRQAVTNLARRTIPEDFGSEFRRRWIQQQGLDPAPAANIARVAAIAGPILAGGALPAILKALSAFLP